MESKHTPGPWVAVKSDHSSDWHVTHSDVPDADGRALKSYVANVPYLGLCAEHGDVETNAKFIASAPTLASENAALRAFVAQVVALSPEGSPDFVHKPSPKMIHAARALLAAKGA